MSTTVPQSEALQTPSTTYRAAVVHDFAEPLRVEDVAPPAGTGPDPSEVEASGLCHTDIHAAHGDWPVKPSPRSSLGTRASGSSTSSAPA